MRRGWRFVGCAAVALSTLGTWTLVATRIVPSKVFDRGIFVSVAERLRAGDRLYADVWDNKDPLFFWVLAIGRTFGPTADIVIEALWLITACVSVGLVAAGLGVLPRYGFAAGGLAAPLLLTGAFYPPGATHLPGVAVTLAAVAAATWRRPMLSGVLVATVAALKLVILPVTLVLVVVVLVHRTGWRRLGAAALGLAAGLGAFAAVLALRGELEPYLTAQRLNLLYSQNRVLVRPGLAFPGHLRRGLGLAGAFVVLLSLAIASASWLLGRRAPAERGGPELTLLRRLTCGAVASGIVVVAVTGLWPHHAQVVYIAGAMCVVLVARHLTGSGASPWAAIPALALTGVALSGVFLPQTFPTTPTSAAQRFTALTTPSPETTALLAEAPDGTYARLGQHDDQGHAEGLWVWTLACPRFHQYPWDAPEILDQALACAEKQPYLIVSESIAPELPYNPRLAPWDEYVERVEHVLAANFTCTHYSTGRICKRR